MTLHPSILQFLSEIDAFRSETGMTVTAFGRAAVGDGNFVPDVLAGRQPSLTLMDRVRDYMRSQKVAAE